mmetsp:Transcript_21405/g.45604  ORF Transcript_21405/g.45604 Transcript_21405/m.45604 type:complete len:414 (-) Transcript_21405:774-2015(-)
MARRGLLPFALCACPSRTRELSHIELHLCLLVVDHQLVAVDDLHAVGHPSLRITDVLRERHCKVAVGADVHRAMLSGQVPEIALPPGQQLRGHLLDGRQRLEKDAGHIHLLAAEHHEVEHLRVIDVGGRILCPTSGIAVPTTSGKGLRRSRLHALHGHSRFLQALHKVAVLGAHRLDIREGMRLPGGAGVAVDETVVPLILNLAAHCLVPVHLPVGVWLLQVHEAEVLVRDAKHVPAGEGDGRSAARAWDEPQLRHHLLEIVRGVEATIIEVGDGLALRNAGRHIPLQPLGPALPLDLPLPGIPCVPHGELATVVIDEHGVPGVAHLLVRETRRPWGLACDGEESVDHTRVLAGRLLEEVRGELPCVYHHQFLMLIRLSHKVFVDDLVEGAATVTSGAAHRDEVRPRLHLESH